jgi:2-keto-4-pentenoate hydratase/2-oxohepta-3-ene-1,7-dioic acid hydratase in catechol pathway
MNLLGRAVIGESSYFGEIVDGYFHAVVGDIFGPYQRNGQSLAMEDVTLGAPLDGVRFINVMGGFVEPETTRPPERQPMWLPKATNYASGDGAEIQMPAALTGPMQIESELAVVVGKPLRKASSEQAHEAIFGWSVFNDLTAPEYGTFGLWALGKSIDGFTSWGPWIRTDLTETRVMEGLAITATVNGTQVQSGNTKWYCFTPSEMLSHVSHRISLFPGDVVALGTPPPPPEVFIDDHVVCEVEEVGTLNNYIVADTVEPPSMLPRKFVPNRDRPAARAG